MTVYLVDPVWEDKMDNTYLQIGLGLLPSIVFFLLLILFREKHKTRNLVALSFLALIAAACFALHFTSSAGSRLKRASGEDTLGVIYGVAAKGDTGLARQMLQELRESEPVSAVHSLCAARLYVLDGNFKAAKVLYEKCMNELSDDIGDEYALVSAASELGNMDYTLAAHFDAGITQDPSEVIEAAERAVKAVTDAVSEAAEKGDYDRAAESIVSASSLYSRYIDYGTNDREEAKKLLRRMENLAEDLPRLFSIPQLRIARLKAQILLEDFEGIAENIDERASHNELLIASELYLNGYIKPSHFSKEFTEGYDEKYELVAEQLEEVYDRYFIDEDSSLSRAVEEQIKSLEYARDNPVLYRLEEELLGYARKDGANDSTKVYLQLAKMGKHTGNETKAERYLAYSLNTVSDCDDDSFTQPMYEIIGIINDKDNPERLKDVAVYVDRILENTMPIQMPEELTTPNPRPDTDGKGRRDNGDTQPDADTTEDFGTYLTDYVSKKRASVNIVSVDTSEFPKLKAVINVDDSISYTADELAAILSVQDCGADIGKFSVEKVEYTGANILLCCDVSGSMEGDGIRHLKEAISLFVENRPDIVNIALVTFSNYIKDVYTFGTPSETLLQAAYYLYAYGGTDMYSAVIQSINMFEIRPGEINCIILLSDGDDNDPRSPDQIREYIGRACVDKGITLYSIGLGQSVNAEYLNYFASTTGGNYLYVNDPQTLHTFYDDLTGRILNQYTITFEAEDTLSIDRTLKVSIESDSLSYDMVRYSLQADSDVFAETGDETMGEPLFLQDKWVCGLDTRLLLKGGSSYNVNLLGGGFAKEDQVSVELKGNLDYGSDIITCEYKDENTISLNIPEGIACGTYDVHVTINGKKAILDNELTVATQGSEKTTVFGPYVFTSYSKVRDGDITTLSGYVNLNGWLNFAGDVVLEGDLNSSQVLLSDYNGSYIRYYKAASLGLASYYANNNKVLSLPPIGRMMLYNDNTHDPASNDYKVEPVLIPEVYLSNVMTLSSPGLMLYPDRAVIDATAFTTDFPFQKKLLKSSGITKEFSFDVKMQCLLTSRNIGINLEYKSKSDTKLYSPINFGKMPIYYSPADFELKINTVKNEYYIKYIVKVAFIDADGLGFSIKWNGSLVPTEVRLYADFDIKTSINGVPVTFSDFMLGLTNIDINKNPLHWMFEGRMDAEAGKVSSVFPSLEKYVDDLSILKFDDATLKFSLGQGYVGASTDVKLFGIKIAKAAIDCGRFKYTNRLLNMEDEDVAGFRANLTLGIMWESSNCDINLTGDMEFAACDKYLGIQVTGTCDIEFKWWVFKKGLYAQGTALVGVYTDHRGRPVFTVRAQTQKHAINVAWCDGTGLDFSSDSI